MDEMEKQIGPLKAERDLATNRDNCLADQPPSAFDHKPPQPLASLWEKLNNPRAIAFVMFGLCVAGCIYIVIFPPGISP